ncbi:MAG: ABC transporter ATP-binding protein [Gammaproteobacteria bacterium]|nr:ABC transporter ATP-binding protein [Gammaproteobacteria bacterium]
METITLNNIHVILGGQIILNEVNFEVHSGQVLMIAGPNGAGKSTLLDIFLGMVKPSKGRILIDRKKSIDNHFKLNMGYLPESLSFVDSLSGKQILSFFAKTKRVSKQRVEEVLSLIGLSQAAKKATRHYSCGMKQRLGLGIAILNEPKLLILDEPTTGLDKDGLKLLFSILEEWREKNRIVLLATHDLTMLEKRVSHICVINQGKVQVFDTPENLINAQGIPYRMSVTFKTDNKEMRQQQFLEQLDTFEHISYQFHRHQLNIYSDQKQLKQLVELWHQYNNIIATFSMTEPALNEVYEMILEKEI